MVNLTQPVTTQQTARADGKQNSRVLLVCLLGAGIGLTAFLLLKRQKQASSHSTSAPALQAKSLPSNITLSAITPVGTDERAPEGLLHYKNKETRKIEWNDDGFPIEITIEREYYQLP